MTSITMWRNSLIFVCGAALAACASSEAADNTEGDNTSVASSHITTANRGITSRLGGLDPVNASLRHVTLEKYYSILETIRNNVSALPDLSTSSSNGSTPTLTDETLWSVEAYNLLSAIYPPDAIATEHFELLNIMQGRALANIWILRQLPDNASAAETEEHQYRTPEIGQLRRRLEDLDCRLDAIARDNNLSIATYGPNCQVSIVDPQPHELGSPTEPVSVINLRSEDLVVGNPGQQIPAPDLNFGYTKVYAKAGTITLNYDNQNPAPFKHNAVVYRNATGTNLKTSQIVAGTPGGSGPSQNTITFNLSAGTYSIVCNVHLDLQKVQLVVVP